MKIFNKTIISMVVLVLTLTSCNKIKLEKGTVVDHEGNKYKTILIDGMWWMTENMYATTLPNGDSIVKLPSNGVYSQVEPMCYYVNDNEKTKESSGCYYNYEAAQQICPAGWRLPNENDYKKVQDFLYANYKVPVQAAASHKSWETSDVKDTPGYQSQEQYVGIGFYWGIGTWSSSNNDAKLNWMPTGYWMYYMPESECSVSYGIGLYSMMWLSDSTNDMANCILLRYDQTDFEEIAVAKQNGVAVRCVRDAGSTEY